MQQFWSATSRRRWSGGALLAAMVCGGAHGYAAGGKDEAIRAKFEAVEAQTSLEQKGIKPWFLKLDVQLFRPPDPLALPGTPSTPGETGTIEEWWASPTSYRVVYHFPGYSAVEGSDAGGRYRSADFKPVPRQMQLVRRQVVHPMPTEAELTDQSLQERKQDFGTGIYDCLMVTRPISNEPFPPVGQFPSYCLKGGTDELAVSIDYGREFIPRVSPGTFEGKQVVMAVVGKQNGLNDVIAKVVELKEITPTDAQFSMPEGGQRILGAEPVPVAADVMKHQLIHKAGVRIVDSRQRPVGIYTARVVIGTDGHVESLRTVSGTGPTAQLSEEAVAQYVYKPYLVDGKPNEVLTTVTIEY